MLSIQQVQTKLANMHGFQLPTVTLALHEALNYRLAEPVIAPLDVPPAANSAMDGYALTLSDLQKNNFTLPVSQRITAGSLPAPLQKNTCARIFTGAVIPAGADLVIIQEDTTITDNKVFFSKEEQYSIHDNIRPKSQDIAKGSLLAHAGSKITPALMGLLASQGLANISVIAPLKVALLSTGDEIVTPGLPLPLGKIYNSNRYSVGSLLQHWGPVTLSYIDVQDTYEATCDALRNAAQHHDLIISFGGVSVGEEDHIKNAVKALGQVEHWKVKLKPGKPIMAGTIYTSANKSSHLTLDAAGKAQSSHCCSVPILGLPGNPVSAFVTFLLFAKPLLSALTGSQFTPTKPLQIPLGFAINKPKKRPEFMRVNVFDGKIMPCANQSSGVLSSLYECDGLAFIPEDTCLKEDDHVNYYPLEVLIHH